MKGMEGKRREEEEDREGWGGRERKHATLQSAGCSSRRFSYAVFYTPLPPETNGHLAIDLG